jgi:hypothetical protein
LRGNEENVPYIGYRKQISSLICMFDICWGLFPFFNAIVKRCNVGVHGSNVIDPHRGLLTALKSENDRIVVTS